MLGIKTDISKKQLGFWGLVLKSARMWIWLEKNQNTVSCLSPSMSVTSRWDLSWCLLHPKHYIMLCLIIILSPFWARLTSNLVKIKRSSLPCPASETAQNSRKGVSAWARKEGPKDKGSKGTEHSPWCQGHSCIATAYIHHPHLFQGKRNLYV